MRTRYGNFYPADAAVWFVGCRPASPYRYCTHNIRTKRDTQDLTTSLTSCSSVSVFVTNTYLLLLAFLRGEYCSLYCSLYVFLHIAQHEYICSPGSCLIVSCFLWTSHSICTVAAPHLDNKPKKHTPDRRNFRMAPPKMRKGTLDVERDAKGGSFKLKPAVICALGMIFALFGGFVWGVHLIGSFHDDSNARFLPMLMPPVGIAMFVGMFPLFVFVCYSDDFEGLNPILPHHYFFIIKKTIKAFEGGKFKVTAKDL